MIRFQHNREIGVITTGVYNIRKSIVIKINHLKICRAIGWWETQNFLLIELSMAPVGK